ncbi:MAG: hypothetical protein GC181_04890 [Bacteroidetes bacterium]|nr:hypothetical protein [Bacteroidota bacterium]
MAGSGSAQRIAEYKFDVEYIRSMKAGTQQLGVGMSRDLFNFMDNKLRLGFGIRAIAGDYNNISFTTAHPDLRKTDGKVDTLYPGRVQNFAFNFTAHGEYYVRSWFSAGLHLDLIGITTGSKVEAEYHLGPVSKAGGTVTQKNVEAAPTSANAFSMRNQKGTMNNLLYLRFEPKETYSIRVGVGFALTEYSTNKALGPNNQFRFEANRAAYFIGFTLNKFDEI